MADQFPGGDQSNPLLDKGAEALGINGPATATAPAPEAMQDAQYASRADDLLNTLSVIQDTGVLLMPEITRRGGRPITFKVKRLSVQQLIAADLVPKKALQIAGFMIDAAEKRAAVARKRWGLPDDVTPTAEQMAADTYSENELLRDAERFVGGSSEADARTNATAGIYAFLGAVVCSAVLEPRLYFDEDAKRDGELAGRKGALVWDIPESDLWHIFNWALKTEARAVAANVEPFPAAVANAPAMGAAKAPRADAGSPDDV